MQPDNRPLRQIPQRFVKRHIQTPTCLAIKQRTGGYHDAEHFFQAKRLGAKLDTICIVRFGFSPLVFDGKASFTDGFGAELHDISLPDQTPFQRP